MSRRVQHFDQHTEFTLGIDLSLFEVGPLHQHSGALNGLVQPLGGRLGWLGGCVFVDQPVIAEFIVSQRGNTYSTILNG